MFKKLTSMIIAIVMVISLSTIAFGQEYLETAPAKIKFNKEYLEFASEPVSIDGDVYAPYKDLFKAFGIDGNYSFSKKALTGEKDGVKIELSLDNTVMKLEKDGVKEDVDLYIDGMVNVDDQMYVPVYDILSTFNVICGYSFDSEIDTIVALDFSEIDKKFENDPSLSNYRKLLQMSKSFEKGSMDVVYDVNGSYTDAEAVKYDFSGKMKAAILMNLPRMAADMSFEDIAFSPATEDSAMALAMINGMKYSMVMDEESMYMKMSMLGDQWMQQPLDSASTMNMDMLTKNSAVTKPSEMLKMLFASSYSIEENAYDNIEKGYEVFKEFFKNERVTIKEKGSKTTASFSIDKEDVSEFINKLVAEFADDETDESMAEFDEFMKTADFNIAFNYLYNNDKLESYDMAVKLKMDMPEEQGAIDINLKITADVENKDVTIEIPEVTPFEFPAYEDEYQFEEEIEFNEASDVEAVEIEESIETTTEVQ